MSTHRVIYSVLVLLITFFTLGAQNLQAVASVCGAGFGTTPPGAVCVQITTVPTTTITTIIGLPGVPLAFAGTYGEYDVAMVAIFSGAPLGMGVTLGGVVTKVGSDPGSNVQIIVEGGRGGPLPGGVLALDLVGLAV